MLPRGPECNHRGIPRCNLYFGLGHVIVGAALGIRLYGDAQFGLHSATSIGWMTLKGTKAAGTDLHSKMASILGISRDQAKVKCSTVPASTNEACHILLLLQSNAAIQPKEARKVAENLYASTKHPPTRSISAQFLVRWDGKFRV